MQIFIKLKAISTRSLLVKYIYYLHEKMHDYLHMRCEKKIMHLLKIKSNSIYYHIK